MLLARILSRFIDIFIFMLANILFIILSPFEIVSKWAISVQITGFTFYFLYNVIMQYFFGYTIGKKIMHIRLISINLGHLFIKELYIVFLLFAGNITQILDLPQSIFYSANLISLLLIIINLYIYYSRKKLIHDIYLDNDMEKFSNIIKSR